MGISVGLISNGNCILSVCYSNLHESIYSQNNGISYKDKKKLTVKKNNQKIEHSVIFTGIPSGMKNILDKELYKWREYKKIRMIGSAVCSIISIIESPTKDSYSENGIFIWDVLPASSIAKYAGCSVEIVHLDNQRLKILIQ